MNIICQCILFLELSTCKKNFEWQKCVRYNKEQYAWITVFSDRGCVCLYWGYSLGSVTKYYNEF